MAMSLSFLSEKDYPSELALFIDGVSGVMRDNLHGIHTRIKLLRNAIEQTERTPDQQQVGGNGPDALADLHAGIHRIEIFPAPAGLVVAEQHPDQVQQGSDVHLSLESKSGFSERPGDFVEITFGERLYHFAQ